MWKSIVYTTLTEWRTKTIWSTQLAQKKRSISQNSKLFMQKKKNLTNKDWKEITSAEFKPFMKSPQQLL